MSVIHYTVGSLGYRSGIIVGMELVLVLVLVKAKDASDLTGGKIGFAPTQVMEFNNVGDGLTSSTVLAWQPPQDMKLLANYVQCDQENPTVGSGNTIKNRAVSLPLGLIKAKYTFGDEREQSLTCYLARTTYSERKVPWDTFISTAGSFGSVDCDTDPTAEQRIDQRRVPSNSTREIT